MSYRIESIELYVREMPPDRMVFGIGKADQTGKAKSPKSRRPRAILLTRLVLQSEDVAMVTGCSGDRPSFGWLDKRPDKAPEEKLTLLLNLVEEARKIYLECGRQFDSPFALWLEAEQKVKARAGELGAEELMGSFASALFERAVIDAFCIAENTSFYSAFRTNLLGIVPGEVHPQLTGFDVTSVVPDVPGSSFAIRHTVGLSDPITEKEWPEENRINDGEPETLEAYIERDGLQYLKIKISGNPDADLSRLGKIWDQCLVGRNDPKVTLDGNEAYTDIAAFASFVECFEKDLPGLFDHTLFIEQPLTRALTLDPSTIPHVRRISRKKALVIDEADGTTDAFRRAFAIGYSGCSHKNCKGVFKSLLNYALCHHFEDTTGREAFMSAEDLSNMPMIPLHQDFEVVGALSLSHCERNGHHYAFGLSHLTREEKLAVMREHPETYHTRDNEVFLSIREGQLSYNSTAVGFGSGAKPRWDALTGFQEWRKGEGV